MKRLRVIIAGGREYQLTDPDWIFLDTLPITEIVSGRAKGADQEGEVYAKERGIPVKMFPANWAHYGKGAGPIRNKQMAEYADAVVLFPGGKGTASMKREAKKAELKIWEP